MLYREEELPQEVSSLQALVLDLSRRLQNAQHTIDAERRLTETAQRQAEYFRSRLTETVQGYRLEASRLRNIETKLTALSEAKRYEENKAKVRVVSLTTLPDPYPPS